MSFSPTCIGQARRSPPGKPPKRPYLNRCAPASAEIQIAARGHRRLSTARLSACMTGLTATRTRGTKLAQHYRNEIKAARQRLVLCRLMIDIMRNLHGAYAPATELFGTRLETFFIGRRVASLAIRGESLFPSPKSQPICVYRARRSREGSVDWKAGASSIERVGTITCTRRLQFSDWHAKLLSDKTNAQQGCGGIGCLGRLTGSNVSTEGTSRAQSRLTARPS